MNAAPKPVIFFRDFLTSNDPSGFQKPLLPETTSATEPGAISPLNAEFPSKSYMAPWCRKGARHLQINLIGVRSWKPPASVQAACGQEPGRAEPQPLPLGRAGCSLAAPGLPVRWTKVPGGTRRVRAIAQGLSSHLPRTCNQETWQSFAGSAPAPHTSAAGR